MAITFTWADVIALAPELASVAAAGQTQVINQVLLEVNPSAWGSDARALTAALWLARHMGSVNGKGGTGVLASVSVGQVSKSFANPMSKLALQSTRYGTEYLRLASLWMPRCAVT